MTIGTIEYYQVKLISLYYGGDVLHRLCVQSFFYLSIYIMISSICLVYTLYFFRVLTTPIENHGQTSRN